MLSYFSLFFKIEEIEKPFISHNLAYYIISKILKLWQLPLDTVLMEKSQKRPNTAKISNLDQMPNWGGALWKFLTGFSTSLFQSQPALQNLAKKRDPALKFFFKIDILL